MKQLSNEHLQTSIQAVMVELNQANSKIINLRTELMITQNELKKYKDEEDNQKDANPES